MKLARIALGASCAYKDPAAPKAREMFPQVTVLSLCSRLARNHLGELIGHPLVLIQHQDGKETWVSHQTLKDWDSYANSYVPVWLGAIPTEMHEENMQYWGNSQHRMMLDPVTLQYYAGDTNDFLKCANPSEAWMIQFLEQLQIKYIYEPTMFRHNKIGFKPDFYLPEYDLYFELTVMKKSPDKRRKLSSLYQASPETRACVLYRNDLLFLANATCDKQNFLDLLTAKIQLATKKYSSDT